MKNLSIAFSLLAAVALSSLPARADLPEAQAESPQPKRAKAAKPAKKPAPKTPEELERARFNQSRLLQRNWGVDIVGVRATASGWMLRFDYRVIDPAKAQPLTSRKVKPYLIDETSHTALAVPAMENVGELRQVAPLEANRTYFVMFGNPAGLVKKGGTVTLVIGAFRVEGLQVG